MTGPRIAAALERSALAPATAEIKQLIDIGLGRIDGSDDDVLEITWAFWQTDTHGGDGLVVLTREMLCVVLAPISTGLLRRKSAPACVQVPHAAVRDLIDDDEIDGSVVYVLGAEENRDFLLRFSRSAERDRFLACVLEAQRGDFTRWGLRLDPVDYAADFDRFYAEIVDSGIDSGGELSRWTKQRYGDHAIDGALGFALEWRRCELDKDGPGPDARVARISFCSPWSNVLESWPVVVKLGGQLYDAGLLGPPYDERSFLDTGEPLNWVDAGPARLRAVMRLASYACRLHDPRAQEFVETALPHLHSVPASVFVAGDLRELWADIAPLPDPDLAGG